MLSDISKIYDLKKETVEVNTVNELESIDIITQEAEDSSHLLGTMEEDTSSMEAFKKMLTNIDISLLLSLAFFQYYFECCFVMWLPLIVIEKMALDN